MADAVTVTVQRSGRRFEAEAMLDLDADVQTVWDTITDYRAMPSYMPGIRAVRVLEHRGSPGSEERLVVEQQGEFRFMMFAQSMKVRLNIEHEPHRRTEATAVDFETGVLGRRAIDVFVGRYELTPQAPHRGTPRLHLSYTATIGLRLPPPPAVGNIALKQNLAAQLNALAGEVARRRNRR